jgi:endo-1,4-beta-xylanase
MGGKGDAIYELVKGLLAQGVPIDGVGLQMHVRAAGPPSESSVAANMRRIAALGLRVNISEMDVRVGDMGGASANLATQKAVYHSMVGACVRRRATRSPSGDSPTRTPGFTARSVGRAAALRRAVRAKPTCYGVLDAHASMTARPCHSRSD